MSNKPPERAREFEGLAVREGHFLLESGLHAEAWLDLDTLFVDPQILAP